MVPPWQRLRPRSSRRGGAKQCSPLGFSPAMHNDVRRHNGSIQGRFRTVLSHDKAIEIAAAISIVAISAATGIARADEAACQDLERRFETARRDLSSLQVNSFLFSAADNGCSALSERLVEAGGSVQARDREGATVLSHAARAGSLPGVKTLLGHGADPNQRNLQGSTPLFLAIENNRAKVV